MGRADSLGIVTGKVAQNSGGNVADRRGEEGGPDRSKGRYRLSD